MCKWWKISVFPTACEDLLKYYIKFMTPDVGRWCVFGFTQIFLTDYFVLHYSFSFIVTTLVWELKICSRCVIFVHPLHHCNPTHTQYYFTTKPVKFLYSFSFLHTTFELTGLDSYWICDNTIRNCYFSGLCVC